MIFSEPAYFAAIIAAASAFHWLPQRWNPFGLFAMGMIFYAYFSPTFVSLLLAEIGIIYLLGVVIQRQGPGANLAFAAGLTVAVGTLVYFKMGRLLPAPAVGSGNLPTAADLLIPLAISFFTFEFIHYIADARAGTLPAHGLRDFLAFALFVPTLVAGPIKRFQDFTRQVYTTRATAQDVNAGISRVLIGLAKKMVLADTLTPWIAPLGSSDALAAATRLDIAAALIAFSLRIYLDFSGYTDIAIGSARLFGLRVPENFSWPYLKTNITEFWRSWHMSLMSWIRDYVYIPLGGSRQGPARQTLSLLAAFAASGLWHGAALNFLCWGLYHGILVSAHHAWTQLIKPRLQGPTITSPYWATAMQKAGAVTGGLLTFSLVTLGWGLFAMPLPRFAQMVTQFVSGGL